MYDERREQVATAMKLRPRHMESGNLGLGLEAGINSNLGPPHPPTK